MVSKLKARLSTSRKVITRAIADDLAWADHGDTVSHAYAGTGALKSDFTRTGKRSREGMLQDGVNSVMRYVKNNFFDGDRQDAFDILTGAWVARRGAIPPLSDTRPLVMRAVSRSISSSLFFCTSLGPAVLTPRCRTFWHSQCA